MKETNIHLLLFAVLVLSCQYTLGGPLIDECRSWNAPAYCRFLPEPIGVAVDVVLFPFRPILDVVVHVVSVILAIINVVVYPANVIITIIERILRIVVIPAKVIRYLLYIPLHIVIGPLKIFNAIAQIFQTLFYQIRQFIQDVIQAPWIIITLPLRIFLSPSLLYEIIMGVPEGIFTLPIRVVYEIVTRPFRIIMRIINSITLPARVLIFIVKMPLWIVTIPITFIYYFARTSMYALLNLWCLLPMVLPVKSAIAMRLALMPMMLVMKILKKTCFFCEIVNKPIFNGFYNLRP